MTPYPDSETADLAEDARRMLADLERQIPGTTALNAECRPAVDVVETASSIEVIVDVPGVSPDSVRIAVRRNTLLVVGAKVAPPADPAARYHLAERSFGRFARAIRIGGAFDASRARAAAAAGELRVVLPRLEERRGRMLEIPVERA